MQYGGSHIYGIGVLDETYIVTDSGDKKIYECPLTSVGISKGNCEVFADRPQGTLWDPSNVLVDPIKRLVFVADYTYSNVLVFDFDGTFLAPLASSCGALMQPDAMAQRPGLYAPTSPSHPPSSLPAAGERIEVALAMMDAYNSTVSSSHPTSAHDLALEVSATGYITGTNFTTTIEGEIMYNKDSPTHASLTASVVIPYAGDWTLDVTQGTYNVQHFLGSPHLITVAAADTDPASCVVKIPGGRSITAGTSLKAIVETFDEFENPTSHPEDSFKSRVELGNSEENFGNRHVLPASHTFAEMQTLAGVYKLYLYHTNTQLEVAGSPISFDVRPAAADAASSTHNIDFDSFISRKSMDLELELRVDPFDRFYNPVLSATGYAVSIDGGDPIPLPAPFFSYTHTIPRAFSDTLLLSFTLDGAEIANSPVTLDVAPDNTVLYMGIIFGVFLFVFGVSNWLYSKFGKRGINAEKEKEVAVDVKLRKILDSKIHMQDTMTLIEGLDILSDASNAVFKLMLVLSPADAAASAVPEWLLYLFVVLGAAAVPLGIYQVIQRGRQIKASYRHIIRGDDPELAKALDAAGGTLSPESIAIRRSLIVLDMTVCNVGIRGFFAEDLPSILLNSAVLLLEARVGSKADVSTMNEDLEEEMRLKKHSEEELKVMVAALESVSKERQDELKEVMIDSKEVKAERMLGKGGFGVVNLALYRGGRVAMKQLLTVNEENVLRFRRECFLMKNLSHPNVVRLVGVCWSEDLFACCLEFAENGSLEDWLRRTVGGKKYVAPKALVIGKNKKNKKNKKKEGPSLSEVTFKGFDHNGKFNPAEHTDLDRAKKEEAEKLLHEWWMQRMNPKMGWTELLKEDMSRLDHGMSGYHAYDKEARNGRAMAHCYEAPGTEGEKSECWRMTLSDFKFQKGLGFINSMAATKAGEYITDPLMSTKLKVELLVKEYKPPEHRVEELDLTWKGHMWRMALEAALGVRYLHHHRYWSDGGKRHNGATNEVEEEEAGWKESVIHRDLKPDNMLLTRDWTLKLTDFGEARAQNLGGTMTSVGTPIYIAPEVMRADHYDVKADTWSYGLCLVAMIRAERTLEQFFYQALRKHKKRRTTKGLGMGQMTKYYYHDGWRPLLPVSFVKAYPKLHTLIQECWRVRRKERPNFDQIVSRLQGDIGDEIKRKEEPKIELYSKEDDQVYRGRIGKEDEIEDSDGEEGGGKGTTRGGGVSKAEHEKVVANMKKTMDELREKMGKERERADEEKGLHAKHMEEVMAEMTGLKKKLEEKEGADVDAEIYAALLEGGGGVVVEETGEDVDAEIRKLLGLEN
ncbi:hypothetical protein TeGR_g10462 [Tetraparma gracilis]|uniref:Protein kinase domain-containing protein n=1 Tax=Tetraparma gracilis TaxID=2962635 RepID=A0ABQ6MFZ6_9STRA|nr:hypothetical protein TeGR_g10462 [Tetraparma gracilis]